VGVHLFAGGRGDLDLSSLEWAVVLLFQRLAVQEIRLSLPSSNLVSEFITR
jgi:hypothetical protein